MTSKESDMTLFDGYARFAEGTSSLLKGAATLTLGAVLALLVTSIYVVAYVLPLAGTGMVLYGFGALVGGAVGAAVTYTVFGLGAIAFGSISYHEWFVGQWGSMVPITRVPAWVAGAIRSHRNA